MVIKLPWGSAPGEAAVAHDGAHPAMRQRNVDFPGPPPVADQRRGAPEQGPGQEANTMTQPSPSSQQESRQTDFGSLSYPTSVTPALIAQAGPKFQMRVLAQNTGPVTIFFATSSAALQSVGLAASANAFLLLPGATTTFVLAPKQKLYAATAAPGGFMAMSTSEIYDVDVDIGLVV